MAISGGPQAPQGGSLRRGILGQGRQARDPGGQPPGPARRGCTPPTVFNNSPIRDTWAGRPPASPQDPGPRTGIWQPPRGPPRGPRDPPEGVYRAARPHRGPPGGPYGGVPPKRPKSAIICLIGPPEPAHLGRPWELLPEALWRLRGTLGTLWGAQNGSGGQPGGWLDGSRPARGRPGGSPPGGVPGRPGGRPPGPPGPARGRPGGGWGAAPLEPLASTPGWPRSPPPAGAPVPSLPRFWGHWAAGVAVGPARPCRDGPLRGRGLLGLRPGTGLCPPPFPGGPPATPLQGGLQAAMRPA